MFLQYPSARPLAAATVSVALLLGVAGTVLAQSPGENEPNLAVPLDSQRYVASAMPDRIVATPAEDAATGFAVNWRTNSRVRAPLLEIVVAGDSPDVGTPRRIEAVTTPLIYRDTVAHTHRVDVDGLQPDTLYMFRVQGEGAWSGWRQLRTTGTANQPLTLLYFGDTQNKNLSHVSRVMRESMRHAPDAVMALFAGDLISGGDDVDDLEWGEWFEAIGDLPDVMLVAPALGNHEYYEEFEDTPMERRVLAAHWPRTFALPGNAAEHEHTGRTTYWFDANGVRVVVLDGTSALDLDSAQAQAQWLDTVLADNPNRWTLALIHQPIYSPRGREASEQLRAALMPVIERRGVDLMLQGHDHTYGRRSGERPAQVLPQYIVSVTGPKQYRLSDEAKRTMAPTAEDTQLFQVLRIDGNSLRYEARTATGRLYDAFEIARDGDGRKVLTEVRAGRIAPRDCDHRDATLGGRSDRCWE
ncbi:MAG: FN3 domain-containing metallophosphoesterase family protein [Pseudoxanthomonas suwonensis]|nr:FN3 domain-containing metallophosphoesterase family protein [Pseudoxanthomonas suwonensis]